MHGTMRDVGIAVSGSICKFFTRKMGINRKGADRCDSGYNKLAVVTGKLLNASATELAADSAL